MRCTETLVTVEPGELGSTRQRPWGWLCVDFTQQNSNIHLNLYHADTETCKYFFWTRAIYSVVVEMS